jgi:hypothetical protein
MLSKILIVPSPFVSSRADSNTSQPPSGEGVGVSVWVGCGEDVAEGEGVTVGEANVADATGVIVAVASVTGIFCRVAVTLGATFWYIS